MNNPNDEARFTHYATSQIIRVTLDGQVGNLGQQGIIAQASPSPDGKYILVETVHPPFSYTVPVQRFPSRVEVWDMEGNLVRLLCEIPMADQVPVAFASVRTGPRGHEWRADAPATLCWAEALDGGDARTETDKRDQVYLLPAPFSGKPVPLITLGLRYGGIQWGNDNLAHRHHDRHDRDSVRGSAGHTRCGNSDPGCRGRSSRARAPCVAGRRPRRYRRALSFHAPVQSVPHRRAGTRVRRAACIRSCCAICHRHRHRLTPGRTQQGKAGSP